MNDKLRKQRAAPAQTARPPLQARLFRRERIVTAAVILLGLLCLILTLLVFRNPGNQRYTFAPQSFYMLQPESVTEESIPDYAGIRVSYSFTVPDGAKVRHGAKMCIFLEHCIAEIRLDGELHYSSAEAEDPHVGRTPGRLWLSVPMRSDYSGKTVTVTLTPVYDAGSLASPPYLFIEREQLMTRILLPEDLTALVIGIVTLVVGLFLVVFSALLRLDRHLQLMLFLLGVLAAVTALRVLTALPTVLLALDIHGIEKGLWYLSAASALLSPVLILRYLGQQRPEQAYGRLAPLLCAGAGVVLILLQLLNLLDLWYALPWYALFGIALELSLVLALRFSRLELITGLLFPAAGLADVILTRVQGTERHAIVGLIWVALYLVLHSSGFISEAISREKALRQKEDELHRAKVEQLLQHIRPHFIYNTLSSIYVLCKNGSPRTLPVLESFMTFLHANFTNIDADNPISFQEELQCASAYLEVESMRYGELLTVEYDTPHTVFRLPAFTLQPIVENAVKHGLKQEKATLRILIRSRRDRDCSLITVEDNGPGFDPRASTESAGIGLQNVRERLEMSVGGSLEIAPRPGGGTVVTIRIPDSHDQT